MDLIPIQLVSSQESENLAMYMWGKTEEEIWGTNIEDWGTQNAK